MISTGLLITTAGAHAEVESTDGQLIRCHVRKNADPIITGDIVTYELTAEGTGIITGFLPRTSLLFRPENKHKHKLLAANIDYIIIVLAPPPIFSADMLDRYLLAAHQMKIAPVIVLNKIDLMDDTMFKNMHKTLDIYQQAGYPVLYSSIHDTVSLNRLSEFLKNKSAVLVGQSGVGKSSLIQKQTLQSTIRTGDTSTTGLGKHTTTVTRLYHLSNGGKLIDSPGVREFGLWHISYVDIQYGFLEFEPFLGECKFRNCLHLSEPHCAIQAAVSDGKISTQRYQSYQKIVSQLR